LGVLLQASIQNTVRNKVRNFIWVPFANGFRGECKLFDHVYIYKWKFLEGWGGWLSSDLNQERKGKVWRKVYSQPIYRRSLH